MKDDTNWMQTKDVPPNCRHYFSKYQQQFHPRAMAMNPQGRFHSVTWFPQTSQHSSSHMLSHHSQQSKYPTLFYPACTNQHNVPPPFSATQSPRQSFSFFQYLQYNFPRISMLELLGLAVMRKTRHGPMRLRHAGPKSWMNCTSDHYNQLSHG